MLDGACCSARADLHATHTYFRLPCSHPLQTLQFVFRLPSGQELQSAQLFFTLPCGHGLQSAHLVFRLPCGQELQSAQLSFTLPCGQGLQFAQLSFRLPCGQGLQSTQCHLNLSCGHRFRFVPIPHARHLPRATVCASARERMALVVAFSTRQTSTSRFFHSGRQKTSRFAGPRASVILRCRPHEREGAQSSRTCGGAASTRHARAPSGHFARLRRSARGPPSAASDPETTRASSSIARGESDRTRRVVSSSCPSSGSGAR